MSDGGGDGELWVLKVVMVAVGGKEKERMRVIKLQHFMGFNIYIYIYIVGLI